MTDYRPLTYVDSKIQVDSAIRDEDGVRIKTNYAKKTEIKDGVLTINTNGGSTLGTFSANQSANQTITLPNGSVQLINQEVHFVSDNTYEEFPYHATVSVTGVTSSTYAEVTYSEEQATSLNFATFCDTGAGVIHLYSRTNVGTVTIPTISIGMDYSDITIDSTPTSGSGNAVSSGGVHAALATKQDTLTFDSTPTDGSSNPVTSDGVYEGLKALYPVGSIYMNATNSTNPGTLLGFGTWQELAPGRVLMGAGTGTDSNTTSQTFTAGTTTGEYTHTLTTTEMPSHGHSVSVNATDINHTHSGTTAEDGWNHYHEATTGGGGAHTGSIGNIAIDSGQGAGWDPSVSGVFTQTNRGGACSSGSSNKSATFTLTVGDHTHWLRTGTASANHTHGFTTGWMNQNNSHGHTVNQSDVGGGGAHNNVQPSLVVYMWVRTA